MLSVCNVRNCCWWRPFYPNRPRLSIEDQLQFTQIQHRMFYPCYDSSKTLAEFRRSLTWDIRNTLTSFLSLKRLFKKMKNVFRQNPLTKHYFTKQTLKQIKYMHYRQPQRREYKKPHEKVMKNNQASVFTKKFKPYTHIHIYFIH